MRWGPGPVFVYECVTDARRWQPYAARSVGVAVLLLGMATIAWSNEGILQGASAREYARLGEYYFYALIGMELSLVMLAAPAATAGAICFDRARGTLTHVLATDLSDSEIVVGKLAARLLPVLGLVACTWPVMAICVLLGGIDPVILTMAFVVIVAVVTSVGLALATWIKHQSRAIALSVFTFVLVSVAWPIAAYVAGPWRYAQGLAALSPVNAAAILIDKGMIQGQIWSFHLWVIFWDVMVAYVAFAVLLLTIRSFDCCFGRTPDQIRRSPFAADLVALLAGGIGIACVAGAIVIWVNEFYPQSLSFEGLIGLLGATFTIMVVLSVLPAVAIFAVPVDGSAHAAKGIVACWWRATRLALALAAGPGLIALGLATARAVTPTWPLPMLPQNLPPLGPLNLGHRLMDVVLLLATIFAQGAVISALSLTLYVWTKRRDRAIALSAGLFMVAAIAWPLFIWYSEPYVGFYGLTMLSFLSISTSLAAELLTREPQYPSLFAWAIFRVVFLTLVTIGLLWRTMRTIVRRVVQTRTRDLLVESGSAINQRDPRSRPLVQKVPQQFSLGRAVSTIALGNTLVSTHLTSRTTTIWTIKFVRGPCARSARQAR